MMKNGFLLPLLSLVVGFMALAVSPHAALAAAAPGSLGGACTAQHTCNDAYFCDARNICSFDKFQSVTDIAEHPGATNQASALTPDQAKSDFNACKKSADGGKCELTTADGVNVGCVKDPTDVDSWNCVFTYPDNSVVTADRNFVDGSKFNNYDSQGHLVGNQDTGILSKAWQLVTHGNLTTGQGTLQGQDFNGGQCSPTHPLICLQQAGMWLVTQIALLFLFFAAVFAGLAGWLLNWIVYVTVFQFGNIIGNNAGLLAAWGVLRDIGNIALLFGFIFMGVSTILNLPGNEFTARRALPSLIIFAILMNFSLFAAEAVIDASNAVGTSFYRQASQGMCGPDEGFFECATNNGIGGSVLKVSGISAIFDPDIQDQLRGDPNSSTYDLSKLIEILGLTIFAAVCAFVFLAAVLMFVYRAVVLAFIMAVSPIGFAGMAIPPLHEYAKQWWTQLLSQAFFAPVYILLVLISIKFMEGINTAISANTGVTATNLANVFATSGQTNVSMVLNFMLIIGFMLGSVIAAKNMGAYGAGSATKMAGAAVFGGMARVTGFAVGGGFRLARYGVQQTAGRSSNGLIRGMGATASTFLKGGEKLNTDLRNFPGMGAVHDIAGGPAQHASYDDMQHQLHGVKEKMRTDRAEFEKETSMQQLRRELHNPKFTKLKPESEKFLAGLSADQIAANHDLVHSLENAADLLSDDQFDSLMAHKDVSESAKAAMRNSRFDKMAVFVADAAANPGDAAKQKLARDAVQKVSDKGMAQLAQSSKHAGLFEDDTFAAMLTDDQADKAKSNQRILQSQKDKLRTARENRFEPARAAATVAGMSAESFGKLSGSTLQKPDVLRAASGRQLAAIDPQKLSPAELSTVVRHLRTLRASRSSVWAEFSTLVRANPDHRWSGTTI